MYIITGLGRCGTSILIKYLKECGYGIGKNVNWYEEARAGYELSTFYSIIDYMYVDFCKVGKEVNLDADVPGDYWNGFTYAGALRGFDKDERQGKVDVVKDPRLTWHPDLIEAVWESRKDIKIIVCHRDIEAIIQSRGSLSVRWHDPKPRNNSHEYMHDYTAFMNRIHKLEIPYIHLFFPNFLINTNDAYIKLRDFGLKKCDSTLLYKMVKKELVYGRT